MTSHFARAPSGPAGSMLSRDARGGLVLLGLAAVALVATSDLPRGALRAPGPAMLPQALAVLIGLCGAALLARGLRVREAAAQAASLRGPLFVTLAIATFAATIRPLHLGPLTTPGFGLLLAAPAAVLIGGLGAPGVRLTHLLALAFGLTGFCIALFADALNLPIPVAPQGLIDALAPGWSHKAALRLASGAMLLACLGVLAALRLRRRA